MKMRFARSGGIALAVGMVLTGSAALAAGASPNVSIKWSKGAEFPSTATRFDGATVGKKVYFLGWRVDDAGTTDGSIWYYDMKKDKYVNTKASMPVPISNYEIAVLKDKTGTGLYVFGGRDPNGKIIKTVQVYYPKTNKAMVVKSDPWPGQTPSKCVSLPATGVAVVSNTAYVVGGMSFSTSVPACTDDNSAQVWSFDPMAKNGKKWSKEPSLNVARGYLATAVVGKTIYAVGGDINSSGTLAADSTVESWKVGAKSWNDKSVADLPEACGESQAFGFDKGALANTVTLAACGQFPGAVADVLQYDVKKNKWSNVGQMKEARRYAAGALMGSAKKPQLFMVGGYSSDGTTILSSSEVGKPGKSKVAGTASVQAGSNAKGWPSAF